MKQEEILIRKVKQGDRAAMRQLYDQYSGYAMAVGLRYIPKREELKDVLQDSFIKIFSSIGKFQYKGDGSLKSWISRIVANECLDFLRKSNRFTFTDEIPDEMEDEPDINVISDETLMQLIGRLPDGYRAVLNMYVFEDMNHKEIAQRLGISSNTSASQYFHAKKMLAKMIKEYSNRQ